MNSAATTAAVKSAGEARPPGIAKYGVTKESELAVSRRRRLEELREQWQRQFGYCIEFSESLFRCVELTLCMRVKVWSNCFSSLRCNRHTSTCDFFF